MDALIPLRTYDPSKVVVALGPFIITGFAEGTMLNIAPNQAERWNLQVGVRGAKARARVHDRSGRATLSLQQTSASNAVLSALEHSGEAVRFFVKDLSGATLFTGEDAYVLGPPEAGFGSEVSNRDWVIEIPLLIDLHGGN